MVITRDVVIYSNYHQSPFRDLGTAGGRNLAISINLATIQAEMMWRSKYLQILLLTVTALILLLARLMDQYYFACWRLLSVCVVCNATGCVVGRPGRPPGEWAVRRPTLHGGPVRLHPVRATPCFASSAVQHVNMLRLGVLLQTLADGRQ